jgi:Phage capsid family
MQGKTMRPSLKARMDQIDPTGRHTDRTWLKAAREELASLVNKGGQDLSGLSADECAYFEELNAGIDEHYEQSGYHDFSKGGMVFPGGGRKRQPVAGPRGWKAGHWSEPFLRQVKDLAPSGAVNVPSLTGGVVQMPERPTRLVDVVPSVGLGPTDTFAYLRETVRTHNAAEVAPGAQKPESVYNVAKVEDRARTIAHVTQPIKRQDLSDAAMLGAYVERNLAAGVMRRLDQQILTGNGTDENLTGIGTVANTQAQAFDTSILQTLRKALTKLQTVEIEGGVYVISAADWETLELAAGTNNDYALNGDGGRNNLPVDLAARRIWGQPTLVTNVLAAGTAYLADFAGSTQLYERESVQISWSEAPEGSVTGVSAFVSNEIIARGEARFGFAVLRPSGIVEIDTSAA